MHVRWVSPAAGGNGYELLWRTAERVGESQTANVAKGILLNEQDTAQRVAGTWDAAVDAALTAQGVRR